MMDRPDGASLRCLEIISVVRGPGRPMPRASVKTTGTSTTTTGVLLIHAKADPQADATGSQVGQGS